MRIFEDKQERKGYNKWKCSFCLKMFQSQDYLDKHMERMHETEIPKNATVCVGDLCDILQCEEANAQQQDNKKLTCNPLQMERRKFFCIATMQRCFPSDLSDVAHKLNRKLTQFYCDPLTCDHKQATKQYWETDSYEEIDKSGSRATWRVLYWLIGVFLVVFLIMFYLAIYLYKREINLMDDLRRLSSKRRFNFLKGKKIKGY